MPNYPVVNWLIRYGAWFAIIMAAAPLVLGAYLAFTGGGWIFLAIGVLVSVVTYVLLKSYVELVAIIAHNWSMPASELNRRTFCGSGTSLLSGMVQRRTSTACALTLASGCRALATSFPRVLVFVILLSLLVMIFTL